MSSLQREYVLVTGNDDKWREADRILRATSPSGVSPLLLVREKLDLPEIQAATTSEVAIEKARAAFDVLNCASPSPHARFASSMQPAQAAPSSCRPASSRGTDASAAVRLASCEHPSLVDCPTPR